MLGHEDGAHMGAGRITRGRMRPMTLFEHASENTQISFSSLLRQSVSDADLGQNHDLATV